MGTAVVLVLFAAIALRRPDFALVVYFLHWAFCRAVDRPTVFDRSEAWLKRVARAVRGDVSAP